jgi:ABC-type uncharacterized transport system substrate-binding protein
VSDLRSRRAQPRAPQAASSGKDAPRYGRIWNLHLVKYSESVPAEDCERGFVEALHASGLREGIDYTLATHSAQGEMASLPTLMDAVVGARADAVIVLSTPTLQAAMQRVRTIPIVFTFVADPFIVKAAKSDTDHLPNLTGVYTVGPYREMCELLATRFPGIKRVGTLFTPAESNSLANRDMFVAEAKKRGIEVETVPVQTATELSDAALALASRRIDAIVQVLDNLTMAGFSSLTNAARGQKLPVLAFFTSAIGQGAALALSRDYVDAGREAEEKLMRVMAGESPARIPLSPPRTTTLTISEANASRQGLVIPPELLKTAVKK